MSLSNMDKIDVLHSKITKIINDLCKTEKSFYVTDDIMTTSFHCFTLANVVHFQLSPILQASSFSDRNSR